MVIETKRLILRPFELKDAEEFYRLTRDEQIKKYVPFASPRSIHDSAFIIKNYYSMGDFVHDYYFVLEEKVNNVLVGAIIITQELYSKKFDVCYLIGKNYRKRGFITEALETLIHTLPANFVLNFEVEKDNIASIRTISKFAKVYKEDTERYFFTVTT